MSKVANPSLARQFSPRNNENNLMVPYTTTPVPLLLKGIAKRQMASRQGTILMFFQGGVLPSIHQKRNRRGRGKKSRSKTQHESFAQDMDLFFFSVPSFFLPRHRSGVSQTLTFPPFHCL